MFKVLDHVIKRLVSLGKKSKPYSNTRMQITGQTYREGRVVARSAEPYTDEEILDYKSTVSMEQAVAREVGDESKDKRFSREEREIRRGFGGTVDAVFAGTMARKNFHAYNRLVNRSAGMGRGGMLAAFNAVPQRRGLYCDDAVAAIDSLIAAPEFKLVSMSVLARATRNCMRVSHPYAAGVDVRRLVKAPTIAVSNLLGHSTGRSTLLTETVASMAYMDLDSAKETLQSKASSLGVSVPIDWFEAMDRMHDLAKHLATKRMINRTAVESTIKMSEIAKMFRREDPRGEGPPPSSMLPGEGEVGEMPESEPSDGGSKGGGEGDGGKGDGGKGTSEGDGGTKPTKPKPTKPEPGVRVPQDIPDFTKLARSRDSKYPVIMSRCFGESADVCDMHMRRDEHVLTPDFRMKGGKKTRIPKSHCSLDGASMERGAVVKGWKNLKLEVSMTPNDIAAIETSVNRIVKLAEKVWRPRDGETGSRLNTRRIAATRMGMNPKPFRTPVKTDPDAIDVFAMFDISGSVSEHVPIAMSTMAMIIEAVKPHSKIVKLHCGVYRGWAYAFSEEEMDRIIREGGGNPERVPDICNRIEDIDGTYHFERPWSEQFQLEYANQIKSRNGHSIGLVVGDGALDKPQLKKFLANFKHTAIVNYNEHIAGAFVAGSYRVGTGTGYPHNQGEDVYTVPIYNGDGGEFIETIPQQLARTINILVAKATIGKIPKSMDRPENYHYMDKRCGLGVADVLTRHSRRPFDRR